MNATIIPKLTPKLKKEIVDAANKIPIAERKIWLLNHEKYKIYFVNCSSDPLAKLRYWEESDCSGSQCSYGFDIDEALFNIVTDRLILHGLPLKNDHTSVQKASTSNIINVDTLRFCLIKLLDYDDQLKQPGMGMGKVELFKTYNYGVIWATSFVKRRDLPSFVYTKLNSSFSER
jgi:hypothetical protein